MKVIILMIGVCILMKCFKKYKVKNGSLILMIILTIIFIVVYYICTFYINVEKIQSNATNVNIPFMQTIKDILLVAISICGTNLLLNILIEVNSKNKIVTEIIESDVISSPKFYEHMDTIDKERMYNALEENLYFKYTRAHDMFINIREKLNDTIDDYYFEECSYVVSCNVCDAFIEKEITKKVTIKSFDKNFVIKDFGVGNFTSKTVEDIESYKLISIDIDGNKIDLDKDIHSISNKMSNLDEQNEYNTNKTYVYNKPLSIRNDKAISVVIKCKTRTTIDDKASTFRVTKPCKNFSLIYSIKQHDKYRLAVDAFGFLDDADDSTNNTSSSNVNITFRDWIFKNDGVVVVILDK